MNIKRKTLLQISCTISIFVSLFIGQFNVPNAEAALVSIPHNPKSATDIKLKYGNPADPKKVRVLIIPGHEPNFGGAEFTSSSGELITERDLNLELATYLNQYISLNPRYQTFVTRTEDKWNPDFASFYENAWQSITDWQKASKDQATRVMEQASTTIESVVEHNDAPRDVALRLYGITKWANEHDIDIQLHIHFNDDTEHKWNKPGKYSGVAIYVPASMYDNSSSTKAIAEPILKRLTKYNPVSNLKGESTGIINEPELIAIGANNTSDSASMLIEYSYIYEPQIQDPNMRSVFLKDLAFQTYLGLQDFFDPASSAIASKPYDTKVLPYNWSVPKTKIASSTDIFALQTALISAGIYPPKGKTLNDCPRTGKIGACTKTAIIDFQKKYKINEKGVLGKNTVSKFNQLFGR